MFDWYSASWSLATRFGLWIFLAVFQFACQVRGLVEPVSEFNRSQLNTTPLFFVIGALVAANPKVACWFLVALLARFLIRHI